MATLNVFEVTNSELSKALTESNKPSKKASKKVVKESAKKIVGNRFKRAKKTISANKIHLESLQFVKEAEENDEVIDYTPEEDVVLVIDPEMDETPADVEEAEADAEDIIGDFVCKCSICGANYLCDCDAIEEDLEEEEGVCPVCGETGEQIIVGEITPAEEVAEVEDEDEVADEDDVDVDVDVDTDAEDDFADDDTDVNVNINIDADDTDDTDEDEYAESIKRAKRRTMLRRESAMKSKLSAKRPMAKRTAVESKLSAKRPAVESKLSAKRPMGKLSAKRPMAKKSVMESKNNIQLDEVTLNRMLTKFAKENYDNVRFVKISKGSISKNGTLTLEGIVLTTKGSKRATKFTCENFKSGKVVSAKFTETGAITEGAIKSKNAFTINFVNKNNVYTPTALTYNYAVKEGRQGYSVSGKVMNESFKKNRK